MPYKHGDARKGKLTRLYIRWQSMMGRCYCLGDGNYKNYGGRGISVCDEWKDYSVFKLWALVNGYSDRLTIERIDNDGGYSPENCKFIPKGEQILNRRNTRWLTYNGETLCMSHWAKKLGMGRLTLITRIDKLNWSIERALTVPLRGSI